MAADNFNVKLGLKVAVELLDQGIVEGSITGVRVDYHLYLLL